MKNPIVAAEETWSLDCGTMRAGVAVLALALGLSAGSAGALAAQPMAKVLSVSGIATAQSGAATRILGAADALSQEDVISVGPDSHALIEFSDRTRVTLRPNTIFKVDAYSTEKPESALFGLVRGGFRAVTGFLSKLNPDAFRVATPTATMGIRGTEFDARLCEEDCAKEEARYATAAARSRRVVARVVEVSGAAAAAGKAGAPRLLAPGALLYAGEAIATEANGYAVLAFRDGSRITLADGGQLAVERFDFDEAAPQEGRAHLRLVSGTAHVWTGRLAKLNPDAFRFDTPLGPIRHHGTRTSVRVSGCIGSLCGSASASVGSDGAEASGSVSGGGVGIGGSVSIGSGGASGSGSVDLSGANPAGSLEKLVEDVAKDAQEAARRAAQDLAGQMGRVAGEAAQKVTDASHAAGGAIRAGASLASQRVGEAAQEVSRQASDAGREAVAAADKFAPKTTQEGAQTRTTIGKVTFGFDAGKGLAGEYSVETPYGSATAQPAFKVVGITIPPEAGFSQSEEQKQNAERDASAAMDQAEAAAKKAGEAADAGADRVKQEAGNAAGKLRDVATDAADTARNAGDQVAGAVKQAGEEAGISVRTSETSDGTRTDIVYREGRKEDGTRVTGGRISITRGKDGISGEAVGGETVSSDGTRQQGTRVSGKFGNDGAQGEIVGGEKTGADGSRIQGARLTATGGKGGVSVEGVAGESIEADGTRKRGGSVAGAAGGGNVSAEIKGAEVRRSDGSTVQGGRASGSTGRGGASVDLVSAEQSKTDGSRTQAAAIGRATVREGATSSAGAGASKPDGGSSKDTDAVAARIAAAEAEAAAKNAKGRADFFARGAEEGKVAQWMADKEREKADEAAEAARQARAKADALSLKGAERGKYADATHFREKRDGGAIMPLTHQSAEEAADAAWQAGALKGAEHAKDANAGKTTKSATVSLGGASKPSGTNTDDDSKTLTKRLATAATTEPKRTTMSTATGVGGSAGTGANDTGASVSGAGATDAEALAARIAAAEAEAAARKARGRADFFARGAEEGKVAQWMADKEREKADEAAEAARQARDKANALSLKGAERVADRGGAAAGGFDADTAQDAASSRDRTGIEVNVWDGSVEVGAGDDIRMVRQGEKGLLAEAGGNTTVTVAAAGTGATSGAPRPDRVTVDPALFDGKPKDVQAGLYVWVQEGTIILNQGGQTLEVSAGSAAVATAGGVVPLETVPNFMRFDATPRPTRAGTGHVLPAFRGGDGSIGTCAAK